MRIKKAILAAVSLLLIVALFPAVAMADGENIQPEGDPAGYFLPLFVNPSDVVVNQPFIIQISTSDSTGPLGDIPVTISSNNLTGTLSGVTGTHPDPNKTENNYFYATVQFTTTVHNQAIRISCTFSGGSEFTYVFYVTAGPYGKLHTIDCDSPITSLAPGASGTFQVVLRDEWGNTITKEGETINATVNGTGGSRITQSATTDANGAASFTLTAGSAEEQVTVTFSSGGVTTKYFVNIQNTASSSDFTLDFLSLTLTDSQHGVTVSGEGIASISRLIVQPDKLHTAGTCKACDEIRRRNPLAVYDISLTHGHTGGVDVFILFSGSTGTYTVLHCNKGVLEEQTAPYQNGGATTTWRRLSPFAVVQGAHVSVPENTVVDPPKTGSGGYGMAGVALVLCALVACIIVRRRGVSRTLDGTE